jgi:hypothetical protein
MISSGREYQNSRPGGARHDIRFALETFFHRKERKGRKGYAQPCSSSASFASSAVKKKFLLEKQEFRPLLPDCAFIGEICAIRGFGFTCS